jgi:putative ABC transport system permease protein
MQLLIAALLFSYPREFRRTYGPQIVQDVSDRRDRSYALRVALDMLVAGLAMRTESFWRDIRFAFRVLIKAPLFTSVILATLALAIAGNAVIFSIVNTVLLQPLPYAAPDRLGIVQERPPKGSPLVFFTSPTSANRDRIAASATTFVTTASQPLEQVGTIIGSKRLHIVRARVKANYFDMLGIHAELGRFFSAAAGDDQHDVVISDALWREEFRASPTVLGKTVPIDDGVYTIRGVAPAHVIDPGFGQLVTDDVWSVIPRKPMAGDYSSMIVRLKDGATFKSAQADLDRIASLHKDRPSRLYTETILPLTDTVFGAARRFLWLVFLGVFAVLLIACANIANLLLVRGVARSSELAVRSSLGASGGRISVQLLTEMLLLFVAGAAIGVGIAVPTLPAIVALLPDGFPRIERATIDGTVIGYVCALTFIVTLIAGVIPSLWQMRVQSGAALKNGGRNAGDRGARTRFALVALEVAIAFALITCSGLVLRSYISLTSTDVGFAPQGVYDAVVTADASVRVGAGDATRVDRTFAPRMAAAVANLPGVNGVALALVVPFSPALIMTATVRMAGGPVPAPFLMDPRFISRQSRISANFFSIMQIPLIRGRGFVASDRAESAAIVNEAFVKRFIPHGNPIGAHILTGRKNFSTPIVGVVGNVRDSLVSQPDPTWYAPFNNQDPSFQIIIRTHGSVPNLASGIVAIQKRIAPLAEIQPLQSLRTMVNDDAASTRATMLLLGALSILALVLALGGIYGLVSYSTQRTYHEIGIRMAIGARSAGVLRGIVGGAIAQTSFGVAVGIIIAAFTTRLLGDNLSSISPFDPITFAASVCVFIACSAIAAFVPALRAARSDPATTLRYE